MNTPNILLKELPRELRIGDKIRYSDGLVTVEWYVGGVNYNYGEAEGVWLTYESDGKFMDFHLSRRKLKEWLAQPNISVLINYEG